MIFDLDPLAHEINVAESTTRIAATKLEFKLRKKEAIRWTKIEGEDSAAGQSNL